MKPNVGDVELLFLGGLAEEDVLEAFGTSGVGAIDLRDKLPHPAAGAQKAPHDDPGRSGHFIRESPK